ncbi:MAG: peptidylprolyl isomerase [Chitinophagales bacterium]|nr:peptidylprolyl isomerase [Chitinophagales bacterium]
MTATKNIFFTLLAFAAMLSSCNAKPNPTEQPAVTEQPATEPVATPTDWKNEPGLYAEFNTTKGIIVCKLEYQKVPMTVGNFVALCEGKQADCGRPTGQPFYDGIAFHRVIPNFMIQGGDAAGNGTGALTKYQFPDEFDPTLRHNGPGVLSMANAGAGTNQTQFFITHVATNWLDDKHSVFGRVVQGQDVVNAIAQGDVMNTVRIIRVGKDAEKFDGIATYKAKKAEMEVKVRGEQAAITKTAAEIVKEKYPNAKKTASGLYYVIEKEGTGPKAENGKQVKVHYTGMLANGKKFDSSYDRNQPLPFTLGIGQVIKGWDEGIGLMKVGSKYKLIIPSELGYGANGAGGVIPPNATLIFDTELMSVE